MKKILVAVDGSPPSLHAARMALELAEAMGAQLTLAYAVPAPFLAAEMPATLVDEVLRAEQARGKALLESFRKELDGQALTTLELEGPAAEAIAEAAERGGYDLIVVGSRGRNALARIVLGSVADRMIHISKRPVVLVR